MCGISSFDRLIFTIFMAGHKASNILTTALATFISRKCFLQKIFLNNYIFSLFCEIRKRQILLS